MKNTQAPNTKMNRFQTILGATLLASVLCACGTGGDLSGQNGSASTGTGDPSSDRIAMPEPHMPAPGPTEAQWDVDPQVASADMESQDETRVYYFGDIQVSSAAELKDFHRYTHIVGNVEITTEEDPSIGWPNLRAVAGDLVVSENESMTRVSFPQLDRVYGTLLVNANPMLEEFTMPDLSRVTDRIYITKNFSLSDCFVQELEESLAKAGEEVVVVSYQNQEGNDCSELLD